MTKTTTEIGAWEIEILSGPEPDGGASAITRGRRAPPIEDELADEPFAAPPPRPKGGKSRVDDMARELSRFVLAATYMVDEASGTAAQLASDYRLHEVKVAAVITHGGKIGFQGTGVSASAQGGLQLVFRRK